MSLEVRVGPNLDPERVKNAVLVAASTFNPNAQITSTRAAVQQFGDPPTLRVTPATQFRAASATKTVIALTIASLTSAGVLELDEPLCNYLPGVGNAHSTLRRTLAHKAGFPTDPATDVWTTGIFPTRPQLLTAARHWSPPSPQRDEFLYSNTGYGVLGLVIEEVTHAHWHQIARQLVLDPLRLDRTTPQPLEPDPQRSEVTDLRALGPAGGLWSTVDDLAQLAAALHHGGQALGLTGPALREITTPQTITGTNPLQAFGLGVLTYGADQTTVLGVHGVLWGSNTVAISDSNTSVALNLVSTATLRMPHIATGVLQRVAGTDQRPR